MQRSFIVSVQDGSAAPGEKYVASHGAAYTSRVATFAICRFRQAAIASD